MARRVLAPSIMEVSMDGAFSQGLGTTSSEKDFNDKKKTLVKKQLLFAECSESDDEKEIGGLGEDGDALDLSLRVLTARENTLGLLTSRQEAEAKKKDFHPSTPLKWKGEMSVSPDTEDKNPEYNGTPKFHLSHSASAFLTKNIVAAPGSVTKFGPPERLPVDPNAEAREAERRSAEKRQLQQRQLGTPVSQLTARRRSRSTGRKSGYKNAKRGRGKSAMRRSKSQSTGRHNIENRGASQGQLPDPPKPAWDSTIHDLTQYRLSSKELVKQKVIHVSRHDRSAQKRLQKTAGVSLEETTQTLNSVLSPTWLIKSPEAGDKSTGDDTSDGEGERGDTISDLTPRQQKNLAEVQRRKELKRKEQLFCEQYKRVIEQVARYETVSGRGRDEPLPAADSLETRMTHNDNLAREFGLMKICMRVVGHLADCEKTIQQRDQAAASSLEALEHHQLALENKDAEIARLEQRLGELEKENVALKMSNATSSLLSVPLPPPSSQCCNHREQQVGKTESGAVGAKQNGMSGKQEKQTMEKISRRHQLMAKWRAESASQIQ